MKSLKNLLLAVIAVISLSSMSYATPHIEKVSYHKEQLKHRINAEFDNMIVKDIISQNGLVLITFNINNNATIDITASNYSDVNLFNLVKQKLLALSLEDLQDLKGKEFNYQFKFKVDEAR